MAGRGHSTLPTISNCVISFISPLPAFGYLSHTDYLNTLALPGGEWHYLYLHYIFDVRSKTRVYKRSIKVEIARGWSVVAVLDSQKCTKKIYFYNTQHKTETLSRMDGQWSGHVMLQQFQQAGSCMEQLISATNQIITVFWWQESSAAFTPATTIQDVAARAPSPPPWWQTKWLFVALSSPSLADGGGWAELGGQNANSWADSAAND